MFSELNRPVQSLKCLIEIIHLVVADSQFVRRVVLPSLRGRWLCFVVFTYDPDLTQCHRLVATPWTHEGTQCYVWKHISLVFHGFVLDVLDDFALGFKSQVWCGRLYLVELVVIGVRVVSIDPVLNHLLVLRCNIVVLQCMRDGVYI